MVLDTPANFSLAAKAQPIPSNKCAVHTSKGQRQEVKYNL